MALHGSSDFAVLIVGGYDILGTRTQITEDHEALFEDTTPFGVTDATAGYVGLKKATFSQNGFYDDTTAGINDLMTATLGGTSQVAVLALAGNTLGKPFIGYAGLFTSKYSRMPSIGKFTRANGVHTVSGVVEDVGTAILFPEGAANSSTPTNGTSVNNGAGSSNGAAGYLQVPAIALGTMTSLTVKIQHSADNATWADLITFANVTASPNAQRVTVTGTVNQYLRAQYTWNGGGTGQSSTIFVGVVRY